ALRTCSCAVPLPSAAMLPHFQLRRAPPMAGAAAAARRAMYKLLFSLVFQRMAAEAAHRAGFGLIRAGAVVPGVPWLLRRWLAPADPVLRVRAFGCHLPGPL